MKVLDRNTGNTETVVETTSNSYLITRTKLTEFGINCKGWFTKKEFEFKFVVRKLRRH